MKYSGVDYKFTSQANHLQKMITLLGECQRQSHHMQRLYKRRRLTDDNRYRSNWDIFGNGIHNLKGFIKTGSGATSNGEDGKDTPIDECYSYWSDLDNEG